MAKVVKYEWPRYFSTAICAAQTVVANTPMVLNGTLSNTSSGFVSSVYFDDISRTISVISSNAADTMNFTITGILNGTSVSQVVAANGTVVAYSTQYFDQITSVVPSADSVGNISIGSGTTGYTHWFKHDYNTGVANLGVQVFAGDANVTYSFQTTLVDVSSFGTAQPTAEYLFTPIANMTNATDSFLENFTVPVKYSRIFVSASAANGANDYLNAYFCQQGIR